MAASPQNKDTIAEIGEKALIRRFFDVNPDTQNNIIQGIGDDCAILDLDTQAYQLISADQLLEGIHFKQSISSAGNIGHKAAAVNISDIAAMGGSANGIFLSLGLPSDLSLSWIDEFSQSFLALCKDHGIPLLGGDTTGSVHNITISVTIIGQVQQEHLKKRSDAQKGDLLCVTAPLGDAAAGLHYLQKKSGQDLHSKTISLLASAHRRPQPAAAQGKWLGTQAGVHAMIDLSDGLVSDVGHIANESKLEAHINVEEIPQSDPLKEYTAENEELKNELLLTGGEDYHLLCTVAPDSYETLNKKFSKQFGSQLFRVGKMKEGSPRVRLFNEGKEIEQIYNGFNHF